eukprot:15160412-Alexandrium_andersonii.AAC.1
MDGCPVGGLAARSEDAVAMDRVAFPLPPEAVRACSDLLGWHRAAQEAAEALGRQGRASPRVRTVPPAAAGGVATPAAGPVAAAPDGPSPMQ